MHIRWRQGESKEEDQFAARKFVRALIDIGVCREENAEQIASLCLLYRMPFNSGDAKDFFNGLTAHILSVQEKGVDVSVLDPELLLKFFEAVLGYDESVYLHQATNVVIKPVAYALFGLIKKELVSKSNLSEIESEFIEMREALITSGNDDLLSTAFNLVSHASPLLNDLKELADLKELILLITKIVPQDNRKHILEIIKDFISDCRYFIADDNNTEFL